MLPATGDLYDNGVFLYGTDAACPVNVLSVEFDGVCLLT